MMSIPVDYVLYINIALVIFLIIALIVGYVKGFLLQLIQTLTVIVALVMAWLFSPALAKTVKLWPDSLTPFNDTVLKDFFYEKINVVVWFLLIFLIIIVLMLLLRPVVKAIGKIPVIKQINRILGMVFSVLLYGIYILIIIFVLNTPLFTNGSEIIEQSWLKPVEGYITDTFTFIEKPLAENERLQNLIANPDQLSVEDLTVLKEWFQDQGIDDTQIAEFFQQIQDE